VKGVLSLSRRPRQARSPEWPFPWVLFISPQNQCGTYVATVRPGWFKQLWDAAGGGEVPEVRCASWTRFQRRTATNWIEVLHQRYRH